MSYVFINVEKRNNKYILLFINSFQVSFEPILQAELSLHYNL